MNNKLLTGPKVVNAFVILPASNPGRRFGGQHVKFSLQTANSLHSVRHIEGQLTLNVYLARHVGRGV